MKVPAGNDGQRKRDILLPFADGMGAARWLRIGRRWLTLPAWPWEATMVTAANCYLLWSFWRLQFVTTRAYCYDMALHWREVLRVRSAEAHEKSLSDPMRHFVEAYEHDECRYYRLILNEHDRHIEDYRKKYGLRE